MFKKVKTNYDNLTKSEISKLNKVLRGSHGNVKMAVYISGISDSTLQRIAAGMRGKKETIKRIRTHLLK